MARAQIRTRSFAVRGAGWGSSLCVAPPVHVARASVDTSHGREMTSPNPTTRCPVPHPVVLLLPFVWLLVLALALPWRLQLHQSITRFVPSLAWSIAFSSRSITTTATPPPPPCWLFAAGAADKLRLFSQWTRVRTTDCSSSQCQPLPYSDAVSCARLRGEDFAWQSLIYPEALIWFYPVGYLAFLPSYSASKLQISLSIRDSEW